MFEFAYDERALAHPQVLDLRIDPRVAQYAGRQYPADARANFGVFLASAPDRWEQRRLERAQRSGAAPKNQPLTESDYLLGVHDLYRIGALRFRVDDSGPFLDAGGVVAAPPFVQLRAVEQARLALEADAGTGAQIDEWLRMLIAPGSSLGGARPETSVVDPEGNLWIAKFPSVRDEYDVGAWELIVSTLARGCGIAISHYELSASVPAFTPSLRSDSTARPTVRDYIRVGHDAYRTDGQRRRLHRSKLSRARRGTHAAWGADRRRPSPALDSHRFQHVYLQYRRPLTQPRVHPGPQPWLALNVSEAGNAKDLQLALQVADVFRVSRAEARDIEQSIKAIVRQWPTLAAGLKLPAAAQAWMAPAFASASSNALQLPTT